MSPVSETSLHLLVFQPAFGFSSIDPDATTVRYPLVLLGPVWRKRALSRTGTSQDDLNSNLLTQLAHGGLIASLTGCNQFTSMRGWLLSLLNLVRPHHNAYCRTALNALRGRIHLLLKLMTKDPVRATKKAWVLSRMRACTSARNIPERIHG